MKLLKACLILTILFGCAGPRMTAHRGRIAAEADRQRVLDALRERNRSLEAFRGFASIRYGMSLFGGRGETAFVAQKPDLLRIDALSDFGVSPVQLATDGGGLTVVWPAEGRYFEGDATPKALARYTGVGLSPRTIVALLLSKVPLGDENGLRVYETGKKGRYVIWGSEIEAVVSLDDGVLLPDRYTVFGASGRAVYQAVFSGYEREDGSLWFPHHVGARFWKVSPGRKGARIEIEYRDVDLNPKIDPKVFELKVPNDAERVTD